MPPSSGHASSWQSTAFLLELVKAGCSEASLIPIVGQARRQWMKANDMEAGREQLVKDLVVLCNLKRHYCWRVRHRWL